MGAVAIQSTEKKILFSEKLDKHFKSIEVLKDFTLFDEDDKLILIKKGSISTTCYFTFHSEETKSELLLNVNEIINNLNIYFKINYKNV